jgi:hypothetical protein
MAFDLKRWQADVRAWWTKRAPRLKDVPLDSTYALLAVSAWLPFVVASADDPSAAMTALPGRSGEDEARD